MRATFSRYKNALLLLTLLCPFCISGFPALAGGLDSGGLFKKDEPIEVSGLGVTYDREGETYFAEGDVLVVQGSLTMRADTVVIDMKNGVASAKGGVVITDGSGSSVTGDSVTVDMDGDTAVIVRGRLFYKEDNLTMSSDEIKKTGPVSYESERTTLTTCDCEDGMAPAWSVRASSARLEMDGYLTAWNPVFYVKNVPVLYSPFVAFPVKTRRQSGFLAPEIGFSRLRGKKVDNSFFWAISDSTDATFQLDVETRRGVGEGLEYRYYRNSRSFGESFLYHFSERDISRVREFRSDEANLSRPMSAESGRWELDLTHTELMDERLTFMADIRLVSDDEYFIDFAREGAGRSDRYRESLESTASVTKNWEAYTLTTEFRRFDNLLEEDDGAVLQRLPVVSLTGTRRDIFSTPVFYSIGAEAVNFERDDGDRGQRLIVRPGLSLPMRPGGLFEFTPAFTPRLIAYRVEDGAGGHETHGAALYEATADLVTTFVRYYDIESDEILKLRHTVRPRITYTYVPASDRSRLPFFDGEDGYGAESAIRYSLNTTLTGKSARTGELHEYLYIDIGQSYDMREAGGHRRLDAFEDRPHGPIDGEIIVRPTAWSSASFKGVYDVYADGFESYDGRVGARHPRGHELSLSYRFLRDEQEYFEARTKLMLTASLSAGYSQRYSYLADESIERSYSLGYGRGCWGAELVYRERPEEDIVLLTFNLRGLGDVISAKTGVGGDG